MKNISNKSWRKAYNVEDNETNLSWQGSYTGKNVVEINNTDNWRESYIDDNDIT